MEVSANLLRRGDGNNTTQPVGTGVAKPLLPTPSRAKDAVPVLNAAQDGP